MELVLDPPHGVAPLRLGTTLDEAIAAVPGWGDPRVLRIRSSARASWSLDGVGVQALLENSPTVTAVEVWWPGEGRTSGTRVPLDGDDVFRTPAEDILRRAAERGWTVDTSRPEYPVIPGASLGFTRQTSQEPRGHRGAAGARHVLTRRWEGLLRLPPRGPRLSRSRADRPLVRPRPGGLASPHGRLSRPRF